MTHHRIWDDTLTSQHDKQHDKSYYFKDIYPLLSENINAIFAGNSKRQYFEDRLEPDNRKNSSLQNVNNIYWVDRIGKINAYSVGTGDGKPKLGYVFVKLIDGELLVTPYHIVTQGIDPVPITQIRKMKASIQPDNLIININFLKFIPYYYERISKKLMFLFSFFLAFFLILLLLIFKRIFISSNASKYNNTWRRELKFIVSEYSEDSIISLIKSHPIILSEIYKERKINNIYFDTIDFKNFSDNVIGLSNRLKLGLDGMEKLLQQLRIQY